MGLRLTRQALATLLDDGVAAAANNVDGIFSAAHFALITAWPGWSPDLTVADLTLANFDGYVGKSAHFSASYYGSDGNADVVSNMESWVPTGDNVDNAILGVALTTANNSGDLIGVDMFAAPVQMSNEFDRLNYALEIGLDPGSTYGGGTVIS